MELHSLKDYDLIKQYTSGNPLALEVLINRHKNKVYSYIFMIVKQRELAEDIFQDAFFKVVKSIKSNSYKDDGKFLGWVMRIAHNLIIDYYRKEKNMKMVSDDQAVVPIFDTVRFADANIYNSLERDQIRNDVKTLIHELPDEQKEVVMLRYYFDYSFKEIAEHTGVSINTALGRMRYAIINMRKLMEDKKMDLSRSEIFA